MNKLPLSIRAQIINLLCEGNSLRATARITDTSLNTVTKLLVDAGKACIAFHDMVMRKVPATKIQCDEIWSFVYSKEKNTTSGGKKAGEGDVWTWVAMDSETKLVISYWVGSRETQDAYFFMADLYSRLKDRVQITTDGLKSYVGAVMNTFKGNVDFAQLVKSYGTNTGEASKTARKYSPVTFEGAHKKVIHGQPEIESISTSHIERQNLTMRMQIRRFTRLTNAFSKKYENHCYAIALHFVYYNFCRIHKTLRVTPAMEAKIHEDIITMEDIVKMIDAEYYDEMPVRSADESYYKPVKKLVNK
jgi:IS1 family transposase